MKVSTLFRFAVLLGVEGGGEDTPMMCLAGLAARTSFQMICEICCEMLDSDVSKTTRVSRPMAEAEERTLRERGVREGEGG